MKKIIYSMSVVSLIIGCTQSISLPQCVDYYKDKPIELKKCIDVDINTHLSPIGKFFKGGKIVNKNESIPSTTLGQDASITGAVQDTSITTGAVQDTSITTGAVQDASITTGAVQDASITTGAVQDASVAEEERKIISDINTMCNSLEQNYLKFNTSSVEPRALNKAKKEYQACKKEQKELKQGLK